MTTKTILKQAFEAENQYGAFYTGGLVEWCSDGEEIVCQDIGKINIISVNSGQLVKTIAGRISEDVDEDEDVIYTFALSPDHSSIVTAHKTGLLKLWDKNDGNLLKMWKGIHQGPVARLIFSPDKQFIASGGCDSSVRIWEYEKKMCTANLRGCQGVIGVLAFHKTKLFPLIFASGDDCKILAWNEDTKDLQMTLEGHYSKVTCIVFTNDGKFMMSSSRDKVIILWDILAQKSVKIIPVYEGIESVVLLPAGIQLPNGVNLQDSEVYAAIGGESGIIKVWEMTAGKLIYSQNNSLVSKAAEKGGLAITQLLYNKNHNQIGIVSVDHNILIHNIGTFHCAKQLVGFSDEILDITFLGKKDRYLAVATNSPDIKLYDTTTMNCQVLKGHTDIVMSLASHKNMLISSAKDTTIRLWSLDPSSFVINCVAIGTKHTASVGSVAMGRMSGAICASASQDTCLKIWIIPKSFTDNNEPINLNCTATQLAHEKDVNSVTISPNDKMIATASQDKTAKLWDSSDLSLLGVLRGHKRGVWCVRFSPVDQIILTSSADCTMKLWAISNMSCLKTFEGHDSSILRAEFLTKGMQILSAGSDGLIKVWSIKTSEYLATLDKHDGRIWAMAIASNESTFFSGGSDSQLIRWKDVTEEKKLNELKEKQNIVLEEQELNNLIKHRKLLKALRLALRLQRPLLTLKIINNLINSEESNQLEGTILKLNDVNKESLLKHASTWNTNSRNCRPAQLVINIFLTQILNGDFRPTSLGKTIEEMLPYTDRHFKRITEFMKDLKFVEYTLKTMQPHLDLHDPDK